MRAATVHEGSVRVREHPDPTPGPEELLVRTHAAGLNAADLLRMAGRYPAPPGAPQDILGLELAGEVVATGSRARRFGPGDRVMAFVGGGGIAELATLDERLAMRVPDSMSWTAAGAAAEVFATAYDALVTQAGLGRDERLLVHGAAGGVGVAAVQVGRAVGAAVTATVRHAGLRERVAALGATAIAPEDFEAGGPYDVVLELVGAPNIEGDIRALAESGRLVVIGVGGGRRVELDLFDLMLKRVRVHASTLRTRSVEERALVMRRLERDVLPLIGSGAIQVPVEATFPLERVGDAYERFARGGKFGKIVVTFDGPRTAAGRFDT